MVFFLLYQDNDYISHFRPGKIFQRKQKALVISRPIKHLTILIMDFFFWLISITYVYSFCFVFPTAAGVAYSSVRKTPFKLGQIHQSLDNSNFPLTRTVFRFSSEFELPGFYCTIKFIAQPFAFSYKKNLVLFTKPITLFSFFAAVAVVVLYLVAYFTIPSVPLPSYPPSPHPHPSRFMINFPPAHALF